MKRLASLAILCFYLTISARSQDFGYKTIDVGGEFQWYPEGYTSALHLAYNFPIHQSFQLRVGYNKSNWKNNGKHDNENGGGPDFSLGYRYYFLVRPHGFFLGVRADISRLTINWREGNTTGTSKLWAIQPGLEMGYMILINDLFFITPSVTGGVQSNTKTEGQPVGDGFIIMPGMSVGFKF